LKEKQGFLPIRDCNKINDSNKIVKKFTSNLNLLKTQLLSDFFIIELLLEENETGTKLIEKS
jgi:hypothetical protein